MNCPKCGKLLSKQPVTIEDDGGLIIQFDCTKCASKFETFVNPILDLEEVHAGAEEFA